MKVHPSFLVSDYLLWALVVAVLVYVVYVCKNRHLLESWSLIAKNSITMVAVVVFCFYFFICLLDSIHLRIDSKSYSRDQVSVLDLVLPSHMVQSETTYSAPLSQSLYVKSLLSDHAGNSYRGHALLLGNKARLSTKSLRIRQSLLILEGVIIGLALGLFCHILFLIIFSYKKNISIWSCFNNIWQGKTRFALKSFWLTMFGCFIVLSVMFLLSINYHVMGTTQVGVDVLYETLKSIRTGIVIGTFTTVFMLPFALVLGSMAGYFGSIYDDVIQYIYITLSSIPGVLLISAVILVMQVYINQHAELFPTVSMRADIRLIALCIVLGITSWATLCRLIRAETLKLKQMDYVAAAKTQGVKPISILFKHILPNVMHIVIITVVLDFSSLVLAEAVLSYVGVGVDPSTFSWGNMINSARLEMAREPVVWWPLLSAMLVMFGLVLSANLLADSVRDAFDPKH